MKRDPAVLARSAIARRLAPILGHNLAFASRDQLLPLLHDQYLDVGSHRERRRLLCHALGEIEKDGLIESQTVGALTTLLAGSTSVFTWSRGEALPDFERETPLLRARYPEMAEYKEIRVYYATERMADLLEEPVHPHTSLIREKLQNEIVRNARFRPGESLDRGVYRDALGDTFITCRLNISTIFIKHFLTSPGDWRLYMEVSATSPIPDYPHAIRREGGREVAILFAGSLGPKILRSVHFYISAAYDGYECW